MADNQCVHAAPGVPGGTASASLGLFEPATRLIDEEGHEPTNPWPGPEFLDDADEISRRKKKKTPAEVFPTPTKQN